MKVLVVYESMYGTTHEVAERISAGLGDSGSVEAVPVADATPERVAAADLLVVGGPTHIHGMSTAMSRHQAVSEETLRHEAEKGHDLEVDPDAEGPGLRDWFDTLDLGHPLPAAAFDTRLDGPALVTGRASKGISRRFAPPRVRRARRPRELPRGQGRRARGGRGGAGGGLGSVVAGEGRRASACGDGSCSR